MGLVLHVMRHAKAVRARAASTDRGRELRRRGRRMAAEVGRFLERLGERPALFVSSSAPRARETAEIVREACNSSAPLQLVDELYLASVPVLMRTLAELDDGPESVLLVGHQPELALLVRELCGTEPAFPTGAIARLQLGIPHWSAIASGTGRLEWLVTPDVLG
jgi:phosphohistidine phosphatase